MKERRILVVTQPEDVHALAVNEALKIKGVAATIWQTSNFPTRTFESFHIGKTAQTLNIEGVGIDVNNVPPPHFDAIWHRRPSFTIPEEILHPADRNYSLAACHAFRNSLFRQISRNTFCVNPPNSEARCHKMLQQTVAARRGLRIAETLYSNNPKEIRHFIRNHGGEVVFKSINPPYMWQGADKAWILHTSVLREADLIEDEILRMAPAIYQPILKKDYELRITIIGQHVFPAKVYSQETEAGRLDWRKAYGEIEIEAHKISPELSNACLALMKDLGIVFGCFDFVVTPDGDVVFLEVNQMGQFLFVERYTQQPLLDAFSEMLIQARCDFDWRYDKISVSYSDLLPTIEKLCEESRRTHVSPEQDVWKEGEGL